MGVPRLIFHKVLFTRRYVEYDTLFLRIEVGPHDSQSRFSDFDSDYWYWVYLEEPFRDTAPNRILISHKVFDWLSLYWICNTVLSGLSWSSWLGFRFWLFLLKVSLASNNFTFGRTMPSYSGHSRNEISQSVFKHSSLFWSETLFLRFKVGPHDLDSYFLTSGTECVACFELSYIWKDHAKELRPLVYWSLTEFVNIRHFVEHMTLFLSGWSSWLVFRFWAPSLVLKVSERNPLLRPLLGQEN